MRSGGAGGQGGVVDPSPTPDGEPTPTGPTQPNAEHKPHTVSHTPTPSNPPAEVVTKTTGTANVALTFDDGPGENTPQILALLRQYHVKATFCLIGVNVVAHPDLVQAIVRDGHTLCNHSWHHELNLGTRSADEIRDNLRRTSDAIEQAAPGVPIRYFRHPGGNFTPLAIQIAKELGMASIGWSVDPWDWNVEKFPPGPTMTRHIISNVEHNTRAGSIVLSHDGGGDRSSTVAAYKTLLPFLTARFSLVELPV
jgi:peptidoglycan/xylan/chitin deacetylase (PgdA/CDA1 family)